MPFRLFHDLHPEVAEAETRSVYVTERQGGLPSGWYPFKEMFCDEPGCDCRRVFLLVEPSFGDRHPTVIAWGWEDMAFYEAWIKYGDRSDAALLQGPILNPGSPETALSPHILDLFRDVLLTDMNYVERVKRHYDMFRATVEARHGRLGGVDDEEPQDDHDGSQPPVPTVGECFLCHTEIPGAEAEAHVAACLKARPAEPGRLVKALHLRVEGRRRREYWMHIEAASACTLHDLDAFLRRTWLECCDHLSRFTIAGQRYARHPDTDALSGPREKSMEAKLYKAVAPGTEFAYEYDYGSTTKLVLRTIGAHEVPVADAGVRILARNAPALVRCAECGLPATVVESGWEGLKPDRCFCAACAETQVDADMQMPIVNSPRVGVCGYGG